MLGLYRDNGKRNGNHGILVGQINININIYIYIYTYIGG